MIGRIKRVPLREVWKHEALDFTTWLTENIDLLNEILDLNLSSAESEKNAGAFNVDITAEDTDGNPVIIENQLEKSDHDHLGKLITYLTSIDAKTAIWVVADPRPEHIRAVTWLNEAGTAKFYMVKVEAVQIGESEPAPLLSLIVGPSEEGEKIGVDKKKLAERHEIRYRFWMQLLERAKTKTKLHSGISPSIYNWVGTGSGVRGLGYNYAITQHEAYVELYIDKGKDSPEENLVIFDKLSGFKDAIERDFGEPLEWQRLEERRACRIRKVIVGGYRDDESKWPEIHTAMIDAMIRLEKALSPHIKELKL